MTERRVRAQWDQFARAQPSRRRRALGRIGLTLAGVGAAAFVLAAIVLPSSATWWAVLVAVAAVVVATVVVVRRAERTARGWGGKPVEERWVNPPRRGGRR